MIRFIRSLAQRFQSQSTTTPCVLDNRTAPEQITSVDQPALAWSSVLSTRQGYPFADWQAITKWLGTIKGERAQELTWMTCQQGWLLHLKQALGPQFHLQESGKAMLLSSLAPNVAKATLDYIEQTRRRLFGLLESIARPDSPGKVLMVVFDDADQYYRYVCQYYPDKGKFALSSGMYIYHGCGHFVTTKADLAMIEPIIVHEMAHSVLSYLPLPVWLNEGIAVSSERRLAGVSAPKADLREQHRQIWNDQTIQQFWSGDAFMASELSLLAYDLAQTVVEQLARDWHGFRRFVAAAHRDNAGQIAAADILGIDLGRFVALIMTKDEDTDWSPQPHRWATSTNKPELVAVI
ncbi:hypothetical protein HNQ59_003255 [Chitinivorax tropicus]|uniref:DUF1570 domain-containing protein n=1 Tax=Chitinivorax tropicus TaxID=714531 RepID=A0A840MS30_9PROT|nr:hypothetical protein [Chitinivorax tropicus]MBB5019947.1 hypothetical protein [Chitinivorax tropicus]